MSFNGPPVTHFNSNSASTDTERSSSAATSSGRIPNSDQNRNFGQQSFLKMPTNPPIYNPNNQVNSPEINSNNHNSIYVKTKPVQNVPLLNTNHSPQNYSTSNHSNNINNPRSPIHNTNQQYANYQQQMNQTDKLINSPSNFVSDSNHYSPQNLSPMQATQNIQYSPINTPNSHNTQNTQQNTSSSNVLQSPTAYQINQQNLKNAQNTQHNLQNASPVRLQPFYSYLFYLIRSCAFCGIWYLVKLMCYLLFIFDVLFRLGSHF
jgi:hypothetical protein